MKRAALLVSGGSLASGHGTTYSKQPIPKLLQGPRKRPLFSLKVRANTVPDSFPAGSKL